MNADDLDPGDGDLDPEELEAAADALAAAANDIVDSSAVVSLAGLDTAAWQEQFRVTRIVESFVAQEAEKVRLAANSMPRDTWVAQEEAFARSLQETLDKTTRTIASGVAESWSHYVDSFLAPVRDMRSLIGPEIDKFIEVLRSHHPRNWPDLDDESIEAGVIATFIEETRWPIVWVPESAVVAALVKALPADRERVLLAHSDTVIANCGEVLRECSGEVVEELLPYASEAVAVAGEGHLRVAQAQAAAVLTTVIEDRMEFPSLRRASVDLDIDMETVSFDRARLGYILSCIPRSLTSFGDRAGGTPVPDYFNRHATLHHVCDVQYTPINALVGLMLMTALLREVDEFDRNGLWERLLS